MNSFKRIIDICEKNGFLKRYLVPELQNELYRIGPLGALLQENLRTEWLNNTVVNKENSVFLHNDGDFTDTFTRVKDLCLQTLPFGVAEFIKRDIPVVEIADGKENGDKEIDFQNFFEGSLIMKCVMFVSPFSSTQFFHHWQRHHRMWWRKFSASPGRYSLTDIRADDKENSQVVDIKAEYPWGQQIVETITLNTKPYPGLSLSDIQFKDNRKACQAHNIVSEIGLSTMFLNTLCDAYEEPPFQGNPRPLFRFHRKIAPYKISFAVSGTNQKSVADDLSQLGLYLCKKLRANSLSSLLLPTSTKHTLETQWKLYDQMGVPYAVLLNERTLKDGIAQLRSRDTTLKEQVHVTNLATYVEQLFKNY